MLFDIVVFSHEFVEDIKVSFQQYGPVTIDWPHKVHSRSTIPPKGQHYAYWLPLVVDYADYIIVKLLYSHLVYFLWC